MRVFMAGNTYVGVVGASARSMDVCARPSCQVRENKTALTTRLSHNPPEILASVLAEQGAMRTISAHRLNSMWRIGSPIRYDP